MTPEEWAQLRAYYHAARGQPPEERKKLLARVREENVERAGILEQLLADDGKSTIEINNRTFFIEHLDFESPPLSSGDVLQNRFKIVRLVGTGGMGDVYEAVDLVDNRTVALKTLTGELAGDPRAIGYLQSEVNLALQVTGPDVCRIHAFYPADGGQLSVPFFTMEFLKGIALSDKLRMTGPFSGVEVKRIARDICAGLTAIHQERIVHRDLKPRNVMLVERADREHAVVMDFGIAQRTDSSSHGEAMAGTREYMAPEQFEGGAVSPATDIFGLGVLLYELLTGVLPFPSTKPLKAVMERAEPPRAVSACVKGTPRHWDRVIARCLAFRPEHRYASAADVFRALSSGSLHPHNFVRDHPRVFAALCMIPLAALVWTGRLIYLQAIHPRINPEAQRWYDSGISALHEGTYVTAIGRLKQALTIDPEFPMIHARLAEAWEYLDFRADAQRELLVVYGDEWRLPSLDKLHFNAIRDTVADDYNDGIAIYGQLIREVPARDQSAADVDLGMAYERSGDIAQALSLYQKAAVLEPSSPAPFMHMAILQNRLLHQKEADEAFDTAEKLFAAELNQEGLAELHYERGHSFNERYDGHKAKPLLEGALAEARALTKTGKDTVPLQVRCLIQMVNADYLIAANDHSPEAVEAKQRGEEAANLARDHGLDAWLADSLVVQANMLLKWHHHKEAEAILDAAIDRARQTGQPRVNANANFALASLMNLERQPERVIQPAHEAREFYQSHGYLVMAEYSSLLITRAYRDQLQYQKAIESGRITLGFANGTNIRRLIMQSEETVGSVCIAAELFPEAIRHYQRAIAFADSQEDKDHETVSYARARWLAGQYEESLAALDSLPANSMAEVDMVTERAAALLTRLEYARAKSLADSYLQSHPQIDPADQKELEWISYVARAHLQPGRAAVDRMRVALGDVTPPDSPNGNWLEIWEKRLQISEAELAAGLFKEAQNDGLAAAEFFATISRDASQLRSVYIAAAASRKLNDHERLTSLSNKVVDISSRLQQNWGPGHPDPLLIYLSRPDIRSLTVDFPIGVPGGKI